MTISLTVTGARSQGSGTTNGTSSYTLSVSGLRGQGAFTTTTAAYTQPAVSATVTVSVQSSAWLAVGSLVHTPGGDYEVTALPTSTSVTLENLGYPGAASPGATVASGSSVTATGARGADGTDGASGATAAWSGATAYTAGMLATLSGVSYVCVLANTNQTPPNVTYWKAAIVEGDSRLTDARAPSALSVTDASVSATAAIALSKLASMPALASRLVSAGTGLTGGGDLSADRTLAVAYGTTGTTACVGNDSRLSDARTPTDGSVTAAKVAPSTNGFVLTTAAGAAAWAQIVNANVDAAAAIDGSKISPIFGAQDITGTARLTIGTGHTNSAATNSACVGGNAATITNSSTNSGTFCGAGAAIGATSACLGCVTLGGQNAAIANGSSYCATVGGTGPSISGDVSYSVICGGSGGSISGSSSRCFIAGGTSCGIATCTNATIAGSFGGTIAAGCDYSTLVGVTTCTIAKGGGHFLAGSTLCTIGNASLAAGNYSAIIASTSCLIGTTTAGATNCAIIASNGSSIQGANDSCAIVGGFANSMSSGSAYSTTAGGRLNVNNGIECFIGGGLQNNIASNGTNYTAIVGGRGNTATGVNSVGAGVLAGSWNTIGANAAASGIVASYGGVTSMDTQLVHAGGYTSTAGERQKSEIIARGDTPGSGANETISLLFSIAGSTPTRAIATQTSRSYAVRMLVTVRKTTDVTVSASLQVFAHVYNNAGTLSVAAGYAVTALPGTLPAGLVGATITLSGSGATLVVTGNTGAGNTTATRWAATIEWVECA